MFKHLFTHTHLSRNLIFNLAFFNTDDTISADIKLETETEDGLSGEDVPSTLSPNMYHPRRALRNAINEWLPEFSKHKVAWGPIVKPQPAVAGFMFIKFYSFSEL